MKRGAKLNREQAENLAIQALGWLSSDGERLGRFLTESGLDPSTIRTAAAAPGFLAAVLEHILAVEKRIEEFAADQELDPASVGEAHRRLAGPQWEREIP